MSSKEAKQERAKLTRSVVKKLRNQQSHLITEAERDYLCLILLDEICGVDG